MPTHRMLLISGASTVITALLSPRAMAAHLIGTPWLPSLKGAILVLEDVGEAPYGIDRMLTQGTAQACCSCWQGWPAAASAGLETTSFPAISRWTRSWKNALAIWAFHWC